LLLAWIYLFLAIATEVAGTMTMNASGHSGNLGMYALMYVFISSSYILLSLALRKIAVGIAIAIWEGFGTLLISSISILFLHERVSTQKILGIACALIGILLLHFGEKEETEEELSGTPV
jgi:spermidine export protein MdtJ